MSYLNVPFNGKFIQCLFIRKQPWAPSSLPTPLHWVPLPELSVWILFTSLLFGNVKLLGGSYKTCWVYLTNSYSCGARARRYWKMSWWAWWTSAQGGRDSPSLHFIWGWTWKNQGALRHVFIVLFLHLIMYKVSLN